jgi:hypothetical protein
MAENTTFITLTPHRLVDKPTARYSENQQASKQVF